MSNNQQQNNQWGAQQQQAFPIGNANFTSGDFPTLGGQPAQQQQTAPVDNPFAAMAGGEFKPTSAAFVPQGVIAMTDDDYPDALDALEGKKKNKQPQPVKNAKKAEEEAALNALPTKGKPSSFFAHQG